MHNAHTLHDGTSRWTNVDDLNTCIQGSRQPGSQAVAQAASQSASQARTRRPCTHPHAACAISAHKHTHLSLCVPLESARCRPRGTSSREERLLIIRSSPPCVSFACGAVCVLLTEIVVHSRGYSTLTEKARQKGEMRGIGRPE
jgi:hypothetical protein